MYEDFTEEARKALALANQEAQRFNHEYVGPEHLLLGIVKEPNLDASRLLIDMAVDLRKTRLETEKRMKCGPDMVTMGKLPLTPELKRTIDRAMGLAKKYKSQVGTEFLLYGICTKTKEAGISEGIAQKALEVVGIEGSLLEQEIIRHQRLMQQQEPTTEQTQPPQYWQIPRSLLPINKFLSVLGYIIDDKGMIKMGTVPDDYLILGNLTKDGITIAYDTRTGTKCVEQIREARSLARILRWNQVPFEEKPPVQKVKESLTELLQILEQ